MRLIDADELVKFLKGCTMSNRTLINTNTMLSVTDKMPTAYNVDKVVAELEELTFEADVIMPRGDIVKNNKIISSGNAIDIVRKGGLE